MTDTQNKTIARRFVEEIFNARKTENAKNFVTPDIIYHGMAEEVRGLEEFKRLHIASAFTSVVFSSLLSFN